MATFVRHALQKRYDDDDDDDDDINWWYSDVSNTTSIILLRRHRQAPRIDRVRHDNLTTLDGNNCQVDSL